MIAQARRFKAQNQRKPTSGFSPNKIRLAATHSPSLSQTMRRLPSQIPETVSRLIKSTYIQTPPIWYQAVLANPPPILPARRSHPRPDLDHSFGDPKPRTSFKRSKPREIRYEEDRVRRQFFRDFPFEALRPTSLVEGLEVQAKYEVDGPGWISLEQRGAYPSVEK